MTLYAIEPRDSALFRDARPFGGTAPATTMPVPWPSTVAGLFRTLDGLDEGGNWQGDPASARRKAVRGPWLAELNDRGELVDQLLPAPRDALFYADEDASTLQRTRLVPSSEHAAFVSNQPDGLLPVVLDRTDNPGKNAHAPSWWRWSHYKAWLEQSANAALSADELGVTLPTPEERIHVSIDPNTGTSDDGNLFMTAMQRFVVPKEDDSFRRFALVTAFEHALKHRVGALGGERRLSFVRETEATLPEQVDITTSRLRVILLTPAIFDAGWRPNAAVWGDGELVAAIVPRPEAISGWDIEKGGPRPSRRAVSAGAVYWVDFPSTAAAAEWANAHHFQSICDAEQDQLDGFGLVITGNGQ